MALLQQIPIDKIEERASELALHSRINYAYRRMHEYLQSRHTWGARHAGVLRARPVAYFSAEFGLHESLPIYSGGLGILAGDHIKSASDLGIPLVGVGLYYDQGYFRQRLDLDGWQHEDYIDVDSRLLPIQPAMSDGAPVVIQIETRTGTIAARVWTLSVGRNTLLLLDSNVEGNQPEDRELTARLYGGDSRVRIRQELLLGVGGVRALGAMGISPGVVHLNEGHSAFAVLELVRRRMDLEGIDAKEAIRRVSSQVVFTTHTPVPAGHDRFPPSLVEEHLGPLRESLAMAPREFMGLGRVARRRRDRGVLHDGAGAEDVPPRQRRVVPAWASVARDVDGAVSRASAKSRFRSATSPTASTSRPGSLRRCGRSTTATWVLTGRARSGEPGFWEAIDAVDDGEIWETHQTLKAQLIEIARRRAVRHAEARGESPEFVAQLRRALSLDALTIGFARRFATYKRANLILEDMEAVVSLLNHPQLPVQLIFAGKSHPRDHPGKEMLQQVARLMRDPRFAGKVLFIEDYDINVGRHLVQGVDLWLNNPRRPLEACGTSGQKVVLNGGLNLSVLDGWWAEAYDGANGFAIGTGETHSSEAFHDARDAKGLLSVLRDEIVPMYYDRDRDGLPREWIARVKRAIQSLGWRFSADRMVMDYVRRAYIPAAGGTSSDSREYRQARG